MDLRRAITVHDGNEKTTVVPMPSANAIPYGVVADKNM
jgi:hypothetical protein